MQHRTQLASLLVGLGLLTSLLPHGTTSAAAPRAITPLDSDVGPSADIGWLPSQSSTYYEVVFVGGRTARVALTGDGRADVDLIVRDQDRNEVAADRSVEHIS